MPAGMSTNADGVAADVEGFRSDLADLTAANQAAAALVLPLAVQDSPRRTGALASSLRVVVAAQSYAVVTDSPYGGVQHARRPWIADVVTAHEADQVSAIDAYIDSHIPA